MLDELVSPTLVMSCLANSHSTEFYCILIDAAYENMKQQNINELLDQLSFAS